MTAQPWEPRLARLEGAYEQVNERLGVIGARLETLDRKVELKTDGLRDELGRRIDAVRDDLGRRIDGLQWRMTALIVGTWITVMLAIIFHKP